VDSENYIKEFALRAISDDYEEFERIFRDVTEGTVACGKDASRSETQQALEELVRGGYAQAYLLEPRAKQAKAVNYSSADLYRLWFYVTPSGKKLARELSKNWSQPFETKSGFWV
jgi:hypothetical protein